MSSEESLLKRIELAHASNEVILFRTWLNHWHLPRYEWREANESASLSRIVQPISEPLGSGGNLIGYILDNDPITSLGVRKGPNWEDTPIDDVEDHHIDETMEFIRGQSSEQNDLILRFGLSNDSHVFFGIYRQRLTSVYLRVKQSHLDLFTLRDGIPENEYLFGLFCPGITD